MSNTQQVESNKTLFILLIVIIVLGVMGIGLAAELTHIHSNTHQNPEFHSLCAISKGMNCETVALSPYSTFLNLPVSVWGIIGYIVIVVMAGTSLTLRKTTPLLGAIWGFCTVAFFSSASLAYISFSKIDSLCLFCMGTYLVNTGLFILAIILLRQGPKNPIKAIANDVLFLTRKPLLLIFIVVSGVTPMGIAYASITPYWKTTGFDKIPSMARGVDSEGDHWTGAQNPKVTVIEYTDYECPYCRTAHKQLRELVTKHTNDVRIVHRHFPLDQACNPKIKRKFHQFACHFSTAAECAAQQHKFWEMNDAIFSSQETQKAEAVDVEKFAIQLGIDHSDFIECMEKKAVYKTILKHINAGLADHVSATPTFIVNGQKFQGRLSEKALLKFLNAAK